MRLFGFEWFGITTISNVTDVTTRKRKFYLFQKETLGYSMKIRNLIHNEVLPLKINLDSKKKVKFII